MATTHSLTMENRKKLLLNGIVEVVSSLDKMVIAKTTENTLTISGSSLRVTKLSLEDGTLVIDGTIDDIKYTGLTSGKSFFKRIFK